MVEPPSSVTWVPVMNVPTKFEPVPIVVSAPTCQKTLQGLASLMSATREPDIIVRALADLEDEDAIGVVLAVERDRAVGGESCRVEVAL